MRRPECRASLFAALFGVTGGVILAAGLALLSGQGGGAAGLICFEAGVLVLMAFGACLMRADLLRRQWDKLRRRGTPVAGQVTGATRHAIPWPGSGPAWTLLCSYGWDGKTYTVRSPLLWREPRAGETVTVYLDPAHPRRAWVEIGNRGEDGARGYAPSPPSP